MLERTGGNVDLVALDASPSRLTRIQENLVDGFSADGLRGLGDDGLFEYNRVQNSYVEDPPDPNHDDGFQSWSVGPGGVGTGEVRGVVLRGNVFINHVNPAHPLRTSMQAIGCFDGFINQPPAVNANFGKPGCVTTPARRFQFGLSASF